MTHSNENESQSEAGEWPDALQPPEPERIQQMLAEFWRKLQDLPDLLARDEHLLADALTAHLRTLVLEMMLALNGIQRPATTHHLNTYLGESQRQAIEQTLVAPHVSRNTWSARTVALIVIYRWYAPQLVAKYALTYPQVLEDSVLEQMRAQIPHWPAHIDTD
jgi:hypothetical protein